MGKGEFMTKEKKKTNAHSTKKKKQIYHKIKGNEGIRSHKANRNYKDTLFRFIFSDKEKLLGLYNALNNSHYKSTRGLTINTLENAVYLNMKNDISFVFHFNLYLFEHQSTFCPNMPLRDLQYLSTVLENMLKDQDLYSSTLVKIPAPHFVVFYNGKEKKEDRMVLKLSDAFYHHEEEPQLELLVTMININYGKNKELMDACKDLRDYSIYVAKLRSYMDGNGGNIENTDTLSNNKHHKMTIEEAVEKTIDECMKEGILADILTKFRAEVKKMSILEYNARLHEETLKKEGYEDGREIILQNALLKGHSPEQIADFNGVDLDEVLRVQEKLLQSKHSN